MMYCVASSCLEMENQTRIHLLKRIKKQNCQMQDLKPVVWVLVGFGSSLTNIVHELSECNDFEFIN